MEKLAGMFYRVEYTVAESPREALMDVRFKTLERAQKRADVWHATGTMQHMKVFRVETVISEIDKETGDGLCQSLNRKLASKIPQRWLYVSTSR